MNLKFTLLILTVINSFKTCHSFTSPIRKVLQNQHIKQSYLSSTTTQEDEIIQFMTDTHNQEFKYGTETFGSSNKFKSTDEPISNPWIWSEGDFLLHDIGQGNAGPSEPYIGHHVYQTIHPMLTSNECDEIIAIGKEAIQDGFRDDSISETTMTNSKLGEARLGKLSQTGMSFLQSLLQQKFYPCITQLFGLNDVVLYDGLILSHIGPSRNQPLHRDASLVTLNIALSDPMEFTGGGTFIDGMNTTVPIIMQKGHALCHASGIMHAGIGVQSGQRWVLVLFFLCRDKPELARRCHARGLDLIDAGDLDSAETIFRVGLQVSPKDHLLLMGLGQIASMKGKEDESFHYLNMVTRYYPLAHKANIAMGQMLLRKKRPRAALRKFLKVERNIGVLEGTSFLALKAQMWDIHVSIARCTLLCAEWDAAHHDSKGRTWTRKYLPHAKVSLLNAIQFSPDDERLQGLLKRCIELENESCTVLE
jgi:tetratricopeptide (TPR) repeat protein